MNTIEVVGNGQPNREMPYIQLFIDPATRTVKQKFSGEIPTDLAIAALDRLKFQLQMNQFMDDQKQIAVQMAKHNAEKVTVHDTIPPVPDFRR